MNARKLAPRLLLALASASLTLVVGDVAVGIALGDGPWARSRRPPFGDAYPADVRRLMRAAIERGHRDEGPNVFDRELGWTQAPGVGGRPIPTTINAIGARSLREYEPEPPEGVRRIVCYGESFTLGSEVADGQEWPAQLEARFEDLEVLNLAVGGYGTDQALLRFRRRGLFGADVAILGLMLENLGRNVNRYRNRYALGARLPTVKPRFVLEEGRLVLVPQPFESRDEVFAAALDGTLLERLTPYEYWTDDVPWLPGSNVVADWTRGRAERNRKTVVRLWKDPSSEPFRVTVALVEAFVREAREQGASRAFVVIFPTRRALRAWGGDGVPFWSPLHDSLDRRGVPWLDASGPLVLYRLSTIDRGRLFGVSHFTLLGNAIVADAIADHLGIEASGSRR